MELLNKLGVTNNSCTIQISDGEYLDTSASGFWGLNRKQSKVRLNNGMIAGIPCIGRTKLIDTLLYDATYSGDPVIYVRNHINDQLPGQYGTEIESGILGSQAVIININQQKDGINLFKGMPLNRLSDFMIDIMTNYVSVDDNMRDFCIIWYTKIFEALKMTIPKEKFCINELSQYTSNWLKTKYDTLYKKGIFNKVTYSNMIDELKKICAIYQTQMIKFANFSRIINSTGLAKLLSGSVSVKEIYKQKKVLLINLYEGVNFKESSIFLQLLIQRLIIEETISPSGAVCMFEDCNIKEHASLFLDLLKVGQLKEHSGSIYFTERNITWWRENLSQLNEHPANYCNAFFVFKQNSNDDRHYWSALSGMTKKKEVSYNSAPLGSVNPLNLSSWKNIILNCCMIYTGSNSRQVDAYHIEEQEIDNLDDKSSVVIIRMRNGIYNRKVKWI